MKLLSALILCVGIVTLCKAESTEKDKVVKEPWKTCAPLYGLDPGMLSNFYQIVQHMFHKIYQAKRNYAYVMNAKNIGVIGCLYKKIGLFKEDGSFNYDYNLSYPKLPEKSKLDSILKGCANEANSDYDRLAACYNRETEGIVRKY